ncbi:MAG: hypothetical protein NVV74_14730 [Magnetospirillum sp.]|nr:hypothetical protein [Magnetospirillum sp.]
MRRLAAAMAAFLLAHAPAPALAGAGDGARKCPTPMAVQTDMRQRLWRQVDAQMAKLPPHPDLAGAGTAITGALKPTTGECAPPLGGINVSLAPIGDFVAARAALDIPCGQDQSAALYHWDGRAWRPFWRGDHSANPRRLHAILTAPTGAPAPLVMTVAHGEWCSSNWHPVQYKVWLAGPGQPQHLLLEGTEFAFLGEVDGPLAGRLDAQSATVEFRTASLDIAIHSRLALRHFRFDGDISRRADPIALTPVNFVEEWLSSPWSLSAGWTERHGRAEAWRWHDGTRSRPGSEAVSGEFAGNALRCRADRSLWQVAVDFTDLPAGPRRFHFLVRWNDPYRFRMVAVAARPWRNCTEDDDPDGRERRLLW